MFLGVIPYCGIIRSAPATEMLIRLKCPVATTIIRRITVPPHGARTRGSSCPLESSEITGKPSVREFPGPRPVMAAKRFSRPAAALYCVLAHWSCSQCSMVKANNRTLPGPNEGASRRFSRLSQAALAAFLGVDPSTVRSWDQELRAPSPLAFRLLSEIEADAAPGATNGGVPRDNQAFSPIVIQGTHAS